MTRPRRPPNRRRCSRCRGVGEIPNAYPAEGYSKCPAGCLAGWFYSYDDVPEELNREATEDDDD